jgi:predicted transcriptional regulator/DNA-binding XRE family transcriptional regulator
MMTSTTPTKATATSPRLGQKLRSLRRREGLTQQQLAERLKISPAYLNLIENGRRPLPAHLLIALAQLFHLDLKAFAHDDDAQLGSDLLEVFGDPLFDATELVTNDIKELASTQPGVARAVINLYRAYQSRKANVDVGAGGPEQTSVPSEDVSDFLQRHMNYFPELEEMAEQLRKDARVEEARSSNVTRQNGDDLARALSRFLEEKLGVTVEVARASADPELLRRYEPKQKRLTVSELLPPRSRNFQLAHQIGLLIGSDVLDSLVRDELLQSADARALARVALANAFAGAVLMPYLPFLEAAEQSRYDIELLGHRFRTSFEQGCHRVCTLRRPGAQGVPFHFLRVDIAGNISKRFSGSGIRFARFAGACPRWNVFSAFLTPGMIKTQVSEFPDGSVYFCISSTIRKINQGYTPRHALHAVGLGCDLEHAKKLVYADGVDLEHRIPVGVTCRVCDRDDCTERAFPAQKAPLVVDENVRSSSFYRSRLPVLR